jgi:muramoyltetrapeptide carboxypeptidase
VIKPPHLQPGNKVGIVATARKISLEEIQPSIAVLESWGLHPIIGNSIGLADNQYAGTDGERAKDLQIMLDDESIKAIFCARGGYGTVRIIDKISFNQFTKYPKWLCGYSDVTVLHSHINQNLNIETIHSTMLFNFPKDGRNNNAVETLKKTLFGEELSYSFPPHQLNRNGKAQGNLTGGNLSLLYSLNNTPSDIDTKGKILFIEDLDEYLYHIDRMMMNLKRSGKLNNLNGLIVGGMTDMRDNTIPFGKTAEEIIFDAVKKYNYPVCFGFPAGHLDDNRALIMGREVELNVEDEARLKFKD